MSIATCKECGFEIDDAEAKFCPECGAVLDRVETSAGTVVNVPVTEDVSNSNVSPAVHCQQCGAELPSAQDRFCPACGAPVAQPGPSLLKKAPGPTVPVQSSTPAINPADRRSKAPTTKPAPSAPARPATSYTSSTPIQVGGLEIKKVPIAEMLQGPNVVKNSKIQGPIALYPNGIIFTERRGGPRTVIPLSEIEVAKPGTANNLLELGLRDGTYFQFKMMGGAKWASLIKQQKAGL
jgi:predicted RNA-binding Zn-ribbon protein involved in translation (DUF1610 family)